MSVGFSVSKRREVDCVNLLGGISSQSISNVDSREARRSPRSLRLFWDLDFWVEKVGKEVFSALVLGCLLGVEVFLFHVEESKLCVVLFQSLVVVVDSVNLVLTGVPLNHILVTVDVGL